MSLKAFHLFFIVLAAALSVVCAMVGGVAYRTSAEAGALAFSIGFGALAIVMAFYGVWFVKKSKNIIV